MLKTFKDKNIPEPNKIKNQIIERRFIPAKLQWN